MEFLGVSGCFCTLMCDREKTFPGTKWCLMEILQEVQDKKQEMDVMNLRDRSTGEVQKI